MNGAKNIMTNVYRPKISEHSKRGATLITQKNMNEWLSKNNRNSNVTSTIRDIVSTDTVSLTNDLKIKGANPFAAMLRMTGSIVDSVKKVFENDREADIAYNRMLGGSNPKLGRVFQTMLPEERAKASVLIKMFSKLSPNDTPMLQAELRTLINVLNATDPKDYGAELDNQIEMVSNQFIYEKNNGLEKAEKDNDLEKSTKNSYSHTQTRSRMDRS